MPRSGTTSLLLGFLFPKGPLLLVWQILIDLARSRTGMAGGKEGKFSTWVLCIMGAQNGCSYVHAVAPWTWNIATLTGRNHMCLVPQSAVYQLNSNLPCIADQRGLHQGEPPGDTMGQAGESAAAAAIASVLMAGCAHGRGVRSERQEACKGTSPSNTDMFFTSFYYHHHRFPTFLVKKKKGWTCHSVHFISCFLPFFVLIRQELQGFGGKLYGSCMQPGKKNCSPGSLRRKLQSEKYCSLLHGKCWMNLLILLRSPWKLGGAQLHPSCTFTYLLLQEISFHGFTPLWSALCSPG